MRAHRVSWLLAFTAVLTATTSTLGQAPSTPIIHQPGTQLSEAQETRIRKRVLLVNVPVTVMNGKGELALNLDAKDFAITDNGVPQEIAFLDLGRPPLSIVLLVETSSRIDPLLPDMRRTGILFADAVMGLDDEAAVVGFSDSVDKLAEFTTDHEVILNTISTLKSGTEGLKLFDAMALGVDLLSSRRQRVPSADLQERRLVIVIMSEASDVGSDGRLDAVIKRAQLYNIAIYSVGIPTTLAELMATPKDVRHQITPEGIFPQPGMPGTVQISSTEDIRYGYGNLMNFNLWALKNVKDQVTGHALQKAATGTGGRHIATFGPTSLQKAVDEIGGELHAQYSLTYEPKGTNETGYHRIGVRVKHKDLKARARPGYYVAPPES
ncbi:MAG TPA: VWA domain-containing protein [Candidatus Acidoferrum sp.]|nr:VWA domain-containing protein [Candidatus Acidoferrum sp.]